MDISNIRKAVDGCEGEFLTYMFNRETAEGLKFEPVFFIKECYYADEIVDMLAESDPQGFVRCVLDYVGELWENLHFMVFPEKENKPDGTS